MPILNKATQWMLITVLASTSLQSTVLAMGRAQQAAAFVMGSAQQELTQEQKSELGFQLIEVAKVGDLSAVNDLVSHGADVNYIDASLNLAHFSGDNSIAAALIAGNAGLMGDVEEIYNRPSGSTPLHWASYFGHDEVVKVLIDLDANVSLADRYGNTPLHWATYRGRDNIAATLITANADINQANNYGQTPLHYAVERGHPEIVQLFLCERDFPLHSAAALGQTERVKEILRSRPDINQVDREGKTPIELAANNTIKNMLNEYAALPFHTLRRENPDFPMDLIKLTSEFMGPGSSSAFEGMY